MPQEFVGEYSHDGENWQPLTEESELSALQGDLFLRGSFLAIDPVPDIKHGKQKSK